MNAYSMIERGGGWGRTSDERPKPATAPRALDKKAPPCSQKPRHIRRFIGYMGLIGLMANRRPRSIRMERNLGYPPCWGTLNRSKTMDSSQVRLVAMSKLATLTFSLQAQISSVQAQISAAYPSRGKRSIMQMLPIA